jgi:hypothetical protein
MKEHLFTAVLIIVLSNYWKIIYENGFIILQFLMNSILWIIFFVIIILLSIVFVVFGYLFTNTGEKTHLSSEKVRKGEILIFLENSKNSNSFFQRPVVECYFTKSGKRFFDGIKFKENCQRSN